MKFLGLDISWGQNSQLEQKSGISLDELIGRLEAVYATTSGVSVTPESAMQSPTVQACVRAIAARMATWPGHVFQKSMSGGREKKELLPNHPVARLLNHPNPWQDRVTYWLDATSWLVRYGNFYAWKARGSTGPIRRLEPLRPDAVEVEQRDDLSVVYHVHRSSGGRRTYASDEIHHARLTARDGVKGDSPLMDVREAIALEIAIEKFGAAFFGNGAMPTMIFQFMQGFGFRTPEQQTQFVEDFQRAYGQRNRFRGLLLPRGIEAKDPVSINNEHAQFLETRKLQRTIIAGALGVSPHKVGDLERATFNNVEQQDIDFDQNTMLLYVRAFEAAVERDLFTAEDRAGGVIYRFNMDASLRADFRTRQEGRKIQREAGVVNPNEWREGEGMNPRTDPGGEEYWDQGPSGQQPGGRRPAEDEPRAPALAGRNGSGR